MLRWKSVILGSLAGSGLGVVLAGLLSLLQPELVFAGFPMGAALGGALPGYYGSRLPIVKGALVGLAVGLVELAFLGLSGLRILPSWSVAVLLVINVLVGMLGARMARVVWQFGQQPGAADPDELHAPARPLKR
jgi:hypothetical protein